MAWILLRVIYFVLKVSLSGWNLAHSGSCLLCLYFGGCKGVSKLWYIVGELFGKTFWNLSTLECGVLVVCLPVISMEDTLLVDEISSIVVAYSGLFGQKQCWVCFQHIYLGLGCGYCFGICSTVDLCRFCVLLLHMDVGGFRQYTW